MKFKSLQQKTSIIFDKPQTEQKTCIDFRGFFEKDQKLESVCSVFLLCHCSLSFPLQTEFNKTTIKKFNFLKNHIQR